MSYFTCLIPTPYGISPLRSNRLKQCSHFVVLSACFYVYVGNMFMLLYLVYALCAEHLVLLCFYCYV